MDDRPLQAGCLLYGPQVHHLDHLAPLSALLQIPLLVTEKDIEHKARIYYPKITVQYYEYAQAAFAITSSFTHLFCCIPRDLFEEIFFFAQEWLQKKITTIWCPHGNSDKGRHIFFMEALQKEEYALLYGKKMRDFLQEKNAFSQLIAHVEIGNYRYQYYRKNRSFLSHLLQKEFPSLFAKKKKTILYAPTWKDRENSSSFFSASAYLIDKLPSSYQLFLKLHPNLLHKQALETEKLIEQYKHRPDVYFILDFPPIYPLLDSSDIYIGDMSSIGYDFLTFQKPMIFLNQNRRDETTDAGLYLYQAGISLCPERYCAIYSIIEESSENPYRALQKQIYQETFGKDRSWKEIQKEVENLLAKSSPISIYPM